MRNSERGQALIATVMAISLVVLVLLTTLSFTQYSGKLVKQQLTYQGQALNAAEAGLTDALSWFRRQNQPVTAFAVATGDTEDTSSTNRSIIRTFQVSSAPVILKGRYEVPVGNATALTGTVDITKAHGKASGSVGAAPGSVWQLESKATIYIERDSTKAYNVSPNTVIATRTVRSEIQKMVVADPGAGTAIFDNVCSQVNVGSGSRVIGGDKKIGVGCNGTTSPAGSGTIDSTKKSMGASYDIQTIFGVASQQELTNIADINVTSVADLPATLPGMNLIVIQGNASFTATRPLIGSGVLVVFGNISIAANSNASWSGVIYCTGNYTQGAPSVVSGAVIMGSSGSTVTITSTGDVSEVDYDDNILDQINLQMAAYRFSRPPYVVGGNS